LISGALFDMEIEWSGNKTLSIRSDPNWRCTKKLEHRWDEACFDDSHWQYVTIASPYGGRPWGQINNNIAKDIEPVAAGIPGGIRIIYLPTDESVYVHNLESGVNYNAHFFDPITGKTYNEDLIIAGKDSVVLIPPRPLPDRDWVFILEPK
jgi:hypothetical protein